MDETYNKVKGQWMYLYKLLVRKKNSRRLLTRRRNKQAVHKFLVKAIGNNSCPIVIDIDKSEVTNKEAIKTYNTRRIKTISIRQRKF